MNFMNRGRNRRLVVACDRDRVRGSAHSRGLFATNVKPGSWLGAAAGHSRCAVSPHDGRGRMRWGGSTLEDVGRAWEMFLQRENQLTTIGRVRLKPFRGTT